MRTACLILSLMIVAAVASAGPTYRWVDADGVHYSDQPHPGAEQITLSRAPVYSSGDNQSSQSSGSARPSASRDNQAFQYGSCAVVQPAQDQMLMNPEMATITVQPNPGLRNGDRIVLSLDGQNIDLGNSGQQQYNVSPISRGTHTVTASIVGPDGSNLCQSLALRFHVQQPRLQRPIPTPH